MSGTYPSDDPQTVTTALVAMVSEAFRLSAPNSSEVMGGLAGAAYSEGMALLRETGSNGAKAVPPFLKAVELNPWSALPYAGLAEAQLQLFETERGEWLARASANVAKARSLNAALPQVLLVSGLLAQQYGRYEDAIRDFDRVAELNPTDSEAWRRLAIAYEHANRADDVAATYERALKAQPDYYRHYLSFGNFYLSRGQFDRAEAQYRKVTQVAPGLPGGHTNLGLALMQQGRFQDAEVSLLAALDIRESSGLLLNIGALYYAQERYGEAARFFERSLASGPPTIVRHANLGDAYRHVGRISDAAAHYRNAMDLAEDEVARNPRQALSRVFLGLVAARLGDRRRAAAELSQSLALDPENSTVTRSAAIGYEALGERDKTLALLSRASRQVLDELARQPDVKDLQRVCTIVCRRRCSFAFARGRLRIRFLGAWILCDFHASS
jgi:tetratricopeptide (TPR) repeat protein